MTLSIGRFGLNPVLSSARTWNTSTGVQVAGRFVAATLAQSLALRTQLEGLVDNRDEDAVPVRWSADPSVDGWYRVRSGGANGVGAFLATGLFDFALDLERISPAPMHESSVTGRLVTNAHGITAAVPWHTAPPGARGYEWPTGTEGGDRPSADGTLLFRAASSYTRATARWLLSPADAYKAAARLSVTGIPVIGHALPAGHDSDWELYNGLVRVKPSATAGMIEVDHWNGTAWVGYRKFKFRISGATGDVTSLTDLHVVHNGPHRVTIRLNAGPHTVGASRTVDLTVRRGSGWAYGYLVPSGSGATDWKVSISGTSPTPYGTTTGSAIYWPETASQTIHRRLLVSALQSTVDPGIGLAQVSGDPNAAMDFGVGYADGTTYGTDSSQVRQYMAGMSEHPRVVAR